MELPEKVKAVEDVMTELDRKIETFQRETTLHCKNGCGKCCFKSDIEATALEFLPFAFHLHKSNQAFEWLDKLNATDSSICLILNPTQAGAGLCSQYPTRGLICRLFGYSARTNKYGNKELVTCQIIKTEQIAAYETAAERVSKGMGIPVMNHYYMQLLAIDPDMGKDFFPINEAIKRAIEIVLQYYAYRQ